MKQFEVHVNGRMSGYIAAESLLLAELEATRLWNESRGCINYLELVEITPPAKHKVVLGFDYDNQAWIQNDRYLRCHHPAEMNCQCYGRLHNGELADAETINNIATTQPQAQTLTVEENCIINHSRDCECA